MKFLVSFCNNADANSSDNLALIDLKSKSLKFIDLKIKAKGATGLFLEGDYIYCLLQNNTTTLVVLDKSFNVVFSNELREVVDPHSLIKIKDSLFIVSTGTDEVLEYTLDLENKTVSLSNVTYTLNSNKADWHHINSLIEHKGELLISMFGQKVNDSWKETLDGYIFNINKNKKVFKGISHPHSVLIGKSSKYIYCESATKKVKSNKRTLFKFDFGYPRGLVSFGKKSFLVGLSTKRKKSKSTGEIVKDVEAAPEFCDVVHISRAGFFFKEKSRFNFSPYKTEIYDIISID